MAASKIHQYYSKKSLKLKQSSLESGKYQVEAICGNKILFKIVVVCQNKTIAKNIAGLKYIEIYCHETFKVIF